MSRGTKHLGTLPAFLALALGCGPEATPPGSGSGDGSGTSTSDSTGAGSLDASDTGMAFECPGARWHEGPLRIDDAVDIDSLRDIGGVTGHLDVVGTTALTDLEFLSCLQEVQGVVSIIDNAALRNLHGLERLATIGPLSANGMDSTGGLALIGNQRLERISALESLVLIRGVSVLANPALIDIGLPAIRRIVVLTVGACEDPPTYQFSNASLLDFGEFPALEYVRHLHIDGQENLASLDSLVALADQGVAFEDVVFERNPQLSAAEIEAFSAAAGIDVEACGNGGGEELCRSCISE